MKLFVLVLLLGSVAKAESFMIEGRSLDFEAHSGLLLRGCEKAGCEALRQIYKHREISLRDLRAGLKHPGLVAADVCHDVYKARSLLGRALQSKDQRAFCYFSDGSMVEINSLDQFLLKRKYVR